MNRTLLMLILAIALLAGDFGSKDTTPQTLPATEGAFEETSSLDDYMASVREQADSIEAYLEQTATTQADMNQASQELYELWDGAMNVLLDALKESLSDEEFEALLSEQSDWSAAREKTAAEAGKDFEGGSMYPLIVNSEAAALTEARVYELYELLKQAE